MRSWKRYWQFAATNWINCVCLAGATYIVCVGAAILESGSRFNLYENVVLGPLLIILGYGIVVWPLFLAAVLGLDTLIYLGVTSGSFPSQQKTLTGGLLLECLIIGSPFIYWAITQDYPLWYFLVTVFVSSQLLWRNKILKRLIARQP